MPNLPGSLLGPEVLGIHLHIPQAAAQHLVCCRHTIHTDGVQSLRTCPNDHEVPAPMPLPTHRTSLMPFPLAAVLLPQLQAPGMASGSNLPTPFPVSPPCHLVPSKSQSAKQVLKSGSGLSIPNLPFTPRI